jgi:hypothetical protein
MILDGRAAFAKKRRMDEQKARALYQFGPGGHGIPPNDEPPRPTRMPRPQDNAPVEAVA